MVYKVVRFEGTDRMKFSEELEKMTLPGRKSIMRVFYPSGQPRFDLISLFDESNDLLSEQDIKPLIVYESK